MDNISPGRRMNPIRRRTIVYVATLIGSVLFIWLGNMIASSGLSVFDTQDNTTVETARVIEIVDQYSTSQPDLRGEMVDVVITVFKAEFLGGKDKGSVVEANQVGDPNYNVPTVNVGDKILMTHYPDAYDGVSWDFREYVRSDALWALAIIFAVLLLFFGRARGFSTILSLIFTCLSIFFVFIPAVLTGRNIYFYTLITVTFIIFMTLLLIYDLNIKSMAACVGCFGGLLASGVLFLIMNSILRLTGYVSEESVYLLYLNTPEPINLRAIVFAAIIIGALGATMDVSVSISSSLSEICETTGGRQTFRSLIRSGLNIGRDIMGSMTNTLILAYIGSSLAVVLVLVTYSSSLFEMINREMVVVEILQSLIGSLGLLCTIPLTSAVYAAIWRRKARKAEMADSL